MAHQPDRSVSELPSEIWQHIAELVGPRSWCRSAAAACKAFAGMPWPTMVIDHRITKDAYTAADEHEEHCRLHGADASQTAAAGMWAPDRRRIPDCGLIWALQHWKHTTHLSFIYDRPEDVRSLSKNVDWCLKCPPSALTELHIHYQPFPEDEADPGYAALHYEGYSVQEWFDEIGCDDMTVCLVACLAKMPTVTQIITTYCAPVEIIAVAERLGVSIMWSFDCCPQLDADGAREPPKRQ